MIAALTTIAICTLAYMLLVFSIATTGDKQKEEKQPKQKTTKKTTPQSSDVIDTLDWMLANSIITPQEYSKLMGKCLPFIQ